MTWAVLFISAISSRKPRPYLLDGDISHRTLNTLSIFLRFWPKIEDHEILLEGRNGVFEDSSMHSWQYQYRWMPTTFALFYEDMSAYHFTKTHNSHLRSNIDYSICLRVNIGDQVLDYINHFPQALFSNWWLLVHTTNQSNDIKRIQLINASASVEWISWFFI